MAFEVKLPPLGDDAPDEAEVSFWYVEEGETVEQGQDMVEMLTDKAAFTVPAPVGGTVSSIVAAEGASVKIGQVMALVEE
ncbi:MAG: biotin/lipoyl-containing protein [Planctomycetota bacterium]|jgi:2-oxoglutarate dehydrogenase E2 component (dihydrolipoamide succinyltransferase)